VVLETLPGTEYPTLESRIVKNPLLQTSRLHNIRQ
jgi:hypothetical protein